MLEKKTTKDLPGWQAAGRNVRGFFNLNENNRTLPPLWGTGPEKQQKRRKEREIHGKIKKVTEKRTSRKYELGGQNPENQMVRREECPKKGRACYGCERREFTDEIRPKPKRQGGGKVVLWE